MKILGVVIVLMFGVVLYMAFQYQGASSRCADKGGIMVRTNNGSVCFDKKVVLP